MSLRGRRWRRSWLCGNDAFFLIGRLAASLLARVSFAVQGSVAIICGYASAGGEVDPGNFWKVIDGGVPRLSGPLFAYVILRMVNFLPLVVARGSWGGR